MPKHSWNSDDGNSAPFFEAPRVRLQTVLAPGDDDQIMAVALQAFGKCGPDADEAPVIRARGLMDIFAALELLPSGW